MEKPKKILHIQVGGIDEALWLKLREAFMDVIEEALEPGHQFTKETAHNQRSEMYRHAFSKMKQDYLSTGKLDVEKLAEIDRQFVQREKELAAARKANEELDASQQKAHRRKLKLKLAAIGAVLMADRGEAALLFMDQVDYFSKRLDEMEG